MTEVVGSLSVHERSSAVRPNGEQQVSVPSPASPGSLIPWVTQPIRSKSLSWGLISFLLIVVLPTLISFGYFYLIASDQYQAEFRFGIRSAEGSKPENLGVLAGMGLSTQSGTDSYAIVQYIQSREVVEQLNKRLGLISRYALPDVDYLSRFKEGKPIEKFVEYWKSHVDAYYEVNNGTVVVKVRAFTAEDSLEIASQILNLSELLVNNLSERSRQDAVLFSQGQVKMAEQRLAAAQLDLRQLRDREGILDPRKTAEATLILANTIRNEISKVNTEMGSLKAYMTDTSPVVQIMRSRLASLETELATIDGQLTSTATSQSSKESLSGKIGGYESADIERQFSERYYSMTLEMLQRAQGEAARQHMYLATFVPPALPQLALYPERGKSTLIVLLACFAIWALGNLAVSSIRDHL